MKKLEISEAMQVVARSLEKPCILLHFPSDWESFDLSEILEAAPYLNWEEHSQMIADEVGIIVCDSYEEMQRLYKLTVGDDGPTKTNPYNGKARIHALTCNAQGELENENT